MAKPSRLLIIALLIFIAAVAILKLLSFTGGAPVRDASPADLPGCPASPNCVCSRDADAAHAIAPIEFKGEAEPAWRKLGDVVSAMGGKRVATDGDRYARWEFRSRIFGYVDDVECLLNGEANRIEIRSASRSGHSDLGVNRKRAEGIRRAFEKARSGVRSPE